MSGIDGKGMIGASDMFIYPKEEELDSESLKAFIDYNESLSANYRKQLGMYRGVYDIEKEDKKPLNKPDNRIAINYAKYLVNVFNGFFAGIAPQISLKDDKQNNQLQAFNTLNSVPDKISDVAKACSLYGRAYMFLFMDEQARLRVTISLPANSFIIYDDTVAHDPLYFVRYSKDKDDKLSGQVYSATEIKGFDDDFKYIDQEANVLKAVPAIEFMENDERLPLYDKSTVSIMNAINKAMSQKANDSDAIADAYLFFKGGELDKEVLENMADKRVIAVPSGDSDAKFLERPSGDGTQEHLLDRLVRNLFQTTMVTNLDDVNATGSDQSGYSIELKMQGMRSLAAVKERKFIISLRQMYQIVFSVEGIKKDLLGKFKDKMIGTASNPVNNLVFNFTRNLPKNVQLEATVAKTLEGIVSKQTQLKAIPSLVDDPQAEIDAMREEEKDTVTNAVETNPANYHFKEVESDERKE